MFELEDIQNILVAVLSGDEQEIYKALTKKKETSLGSITGQLQVRPMLYTLYKYRGDFNHWEQITPPSAADISVQYGQVWSVNN